ncbi:related to Cytochrome oxidase assembly protein SHY1 [Saccharomycodes ludwigii]|uniref:SURF1-like protein n=2 Tax=Saccharomycodes ludwigii TaxID=36035 RepID=A0A376BBE1_9ASCO|nr:related to Cytochrome oxidase assembly protein SHY1 [Saccharomycodes ludwigii]
MPVVSFNLGLWQYRRLNWKTKLVSTCEERLVLPELLNTAVFFDDVLRNDQDLDAINEKIEENWQYRKVKLRGEFDHFGELFVGPRVKNGYKGYQLFTPFTILDDGTNEGKWNGKRVLIERGWISENHILPNSRTLQHLSVPKGYVEVDCLIRVYRKLTNLQWEREDKNSRLWNVIDFPEMCHEANDALPIYFQALHDLNDHLWVPKDDTANITTSKTYDSNKWWNPFGRNNDSNGNSKTGKTPVKYVDTHKGMEFNEAQLIKAGVPIGKLPKVDFKNNHLQYLVTWFGLSFLSSIFLILALKKYAKPNVMKSSEAQKARMKRFKDFM